ncbi:hypothetical protein D3C85_204810 [compost metagenome]
MEQEAERYKVNLIKEDQLIITGKGTDLLWNEASILNHFVSPWQSEKQSEIEFKALWDGKKLFFCFTVFDTVIHIEKKDDSFDSINNSDRVELFFRPDDSLNPYYCLEIDTDGRLMDFIAYPNKNFDFDWNWPKNDIAIKSSINKNNFTVEGEISIESLNRFHLIKDHKIETGIFRAKYYTKDNLNFEPIWITWVNPNTETPNFHTPSSFGILELAQNYKV